MSSRFIHYLLQFPRKYNSFLLLILKGEIISIQLEKGEKGLGITLASSSKDDPEPFVYIKKLVPGSVAERNGRLHAGDRIISVSVYFLVFIYGVFGYLNANKGRQG